MCASTTPPRLSFFFSSRRRHTRCGRDWSSDVCSSDLFNGARAGQALLDHVSEQMRAAADELRFERAAWLSRRRARLAELLSRLGEALSATHARPRLVLRSEEPRLNSSHVRISYAVFCL